MQSLHTVFRNAPYYSPNWTKQSLHSLSPAQYVTHKHTVCVCVCVCTCQFMWSGILLTSTLPQRFFFLHTRRCWLLLCPLILTFLSAAGETAPRWYASLANQFLLARIDDILTLVSWRSKLHTSWCYCYGHTRGHTTHHSSPSPPHLPTVDYRRPEMRIRSSLPCPGSPHTCRTLRVLSSHLLQHWGYQCTVASWHCVSEEQRNVSHHYTPIYRIANWYYS